MLYGAVAVIMAIITLLIINSLNAKTSISIHRQPIASYNDCISLFTENYINVKCQDHDWKFGLPEELKSTVELAVKEYKSNIVPLSAQAISVLSLPAYTSTQIMIFSLDWIMSTAGNFTSLQDQSLELLIGASF